jgi:hypothetical protein
MATPPITALGPVACELLKRRHPVRHPAVASAVLKGLLARVKVSAHAPAMAFESAYGGLSFPDRGEGRAWRKAAVAPWLVGAAACLSSGASFHPPGTKKLVPVLCTANDVVYFLDAGGEGWAKDAIADARPVRVAPNARAMMSRILLWDEVFFCPTEDKLTVPTAQGASVASAMKLRAIADASDAAERWWSDGKTFVVEKAGNRGAAETTVAYPPKGALLRLGLEQAPAKPAEPAGPITFASVQREYAPVVVVIDVAGKVEEIWRAFFEASRHAQPCTIELRVGGVISLAEGKLAGVITEIDDDKPRAAVRVQLALSGNPAFTKKTSRVEMFFREFASSTLINVYQFDVKDRHVGAVCSLWHEEVAGRWRTTARA